MTRVAHAEGEGAIEAGQRADFEGLGGQHVVNDSHISGRVARIAAVPHNPMAILISIIDPERRDKETSVRCRLGDYRSAAGAAVDNPALQTSATDRADHEARTIVLVGLAERFAGGESKLRNNAIDPSYRQPVRTKGSGGGSAHDNAGVGGTVCNGEGSAGEVGQAHEPAFKSPRKRLGAVRAKRATDSDTVGRNAKTLGSRIAVWTTPRSKI